MTTKMSTSARLALTTLAAHSGVVPLLELEPPPMLPLELLGPSPPLDEPLLAGTVSSYPLFLPFDALQAAQTTVATAKKPSIVLAELRIPVTPSLGEGSAPWRARMLCKRTVETER